MKIWTFCSFPWRVSSMSLTSPIWDGKEFRVGLVVFQVRKKSSPMSYFLSKIYSSVDFFSLFDLFFFSSSAFFDFSTNDDDATSCCSTAPRFDLNIEFLRNVKVRVKAPPAFLQGVSKVSYRGGVYSMPYIKDPSLKPWCFSPYSWKYAVAM